MTYTPDRAAHLERINYQAQQPAVAVTPGLTLLLRDDVVLSASQMFPAPDTTHACLLRTAPERADALLDEVLAFFADQDLPPTVYLSPACQPTDWDARLRARGFVPSAPPESWQVLPDLGRVVFHSPPRADLALDRVTPSDVDAFAVTFLTAFEMPAEYAPALAALLAPSADLPDTFHFLARLDGEPVGTLSLVRHGDHGILGSAGVVPRHRRGGIVIDLFRAVLHTAMQHDITALITQTSQGSQAEALAAANGFELAFARTAYTLDSDGSA